VHVDNEPEGGIEIGRRSPRDHAPKGSSGIGDAARRQRLADKACEVVARSTSLLAARC
jgi:hypothetical protein